MFANGFPEDWKSTLKEYFYVVKTTNPLNASHYFSVMARRRSSGFIRCQSRLSTGTVFNKSNRRSDRLSILPAPGALPVPIEEEDEQKENSTSRKNWLVLVPSPILFFAGVRLEGRVSDEEDSIVFVPAVHSSKHDSLENLPRIEYPDSIGPEESDQDFSVGVSFYYSSTLQDHMLTKFQPVFEEPHVSIREIDAQAKESKVLDDDNHLAVVPVSTDVFKIPSRRPSKGFTALFNEFSCPLLF
ncbi:unnamed protein product [Cylicostephanus goldi]|uniref:SANTA domain-containing protein n=1 Tax=Cylicostephanus goldi TaxID=71465 RepID=A0A3P7MZX8_CYLGO|nr:unnamed protein product [Cylicostephanus goldi]